MTIRRPAGPLAGQKVVVTGQMSGPLTGVRRADALQLVRLAGAQTTGALSRRTTILVASHRPTSTRVRAESLGIRVIGPSELAEMLGYPALW